jgi:DNA primase
VIFMSKLAQATSKYTIYAKFEADGTVEKPDVIGAVFGQTEGLLGPDMELRELQRTGRIGRIDVKLKTKDGKTSGVIIIPSSLDSSETALIGACMETIERVGPCNAKINVEKIEDVRISKRKYVVDRAKELLGKMFEEGLTDVQEVSEQIKEAVRSSEIVNYKGLPAGPGIDNYDSVIIVEGRADVINLLRHGIKNVIAIDGTSIPKPIVVLSKEKVATAFLDGDRGGDLILKELLALCDVDFVTRAPRGKEVEELSKKEVFKTLRERIPSDQVKSEVVVAKEEHKFKRVVPLEPNKLKRFGSILEELIGTRAACFLDGGMDVLGRVPVKEMFNTMKRLDAEVLIFDGNIDQKLVNQCSSNGIKYVIGMKIGRIRTPENVFVLTLQDLK